MEGDCQEMVASMYWLFDTYQIVSREDNIYSCLLCTSKPVRLQAEEIIAHIRNTHDELLYICDICGDFYRNHDEFQAHMNHHINNSDGDFQCEVCNQIISGLHLFRIHQREHQSQNKTWACEICSEEYSTKNRLDDHINTHAGHRPYSCSLCSRDFMSKKTMKAHMKTHGHRPRPFECATCSKSFMSQKHLIQHERTHTAVKEFSCEQCHKKFRSVHILKAHSVVHTGLKAFKCDTCGNEFVRKGDLKNHEHIHMDEKHYKCEMCGLRFKQRSSLQSHKSTTHSNEKRYKCQVCGEGFKRRRTLDYHIKAHHTGERPLKCVLCDATFVNSERLKQHARIHTGEKPYSCEVCGKRFNSTANRNTHRYVHYDKKPYECTSCGVSFMRKTLLYQHMRTLGHSNDSIVFNRLNLNHNDQEVISTDGATAVVEFTPTASQLAYNTLTEGPSETLSTTVGTQVYSTDMLKSNDGTLFILEEGETIELTEEGIHISFNDHDLH